jgi:hypothetical protein
MPDQSDYVFQGINYQTPVAYNTAIMLAAYPDAPSIYQTDSLNDLPDVPAPVEAPTQIETSAGGGSKIASDALANGICDRCGFVWLLSDLKYQIYNRELLNLRVCPRCYDQDNPQLWIGEVDSIDASVLRDPRPDINDRVLGRGICGFNPVSLSMPLAVTLNTMFTIT